MLGIIASILIFLSLALPWFSSTFDVNLGTFAGFQFGTVHVGLSIYFFGFIGTSNGVASVEAFPYFSNVVFFTLLLVAGLIGVVASLTFGERSKWLMVLAGTLAIICTPLFFVALESTLASMYLPGTQSSSGGGVLMPGNLLGGDGLSGTQVQAGPSFFWLPILAGILAFISIKIGMVGRSKESQNYPEQYPYPQRYPSRSSFSAKFFISSKGVKRPKD
jgi:hypothetical protein